MKKSFWAILLAAMAFVSMMAVPAVAEINRFRILDQYDFEKLPNGDVIFHFGGNLSDSTINLEPVTLLVDGSTRPVTVERGNWENRWERKYNCRLTVSFSDKEWEKLSYLYGGKRGYIPVIFQIGADQEQLNYTIALEYYVELEYHEGKKK